MRWRKKGAFDFNRPKKHPVNKAASRQHRRQQVRFWLWQWFVVVVVVAEAAVVVDNS
jgi:hypothetical protein